MFSQLFFLFLSVHLIRYLLLFRLLLFPRPLSFSIVFSQLSLLLFPISSSDHPLHFLILLCPIEVFVYSLLNFYTHFLIYLNPSLAQSLIIVINYIVTSGCSYRLGRLYILQPFPYFRQVVYIKLCFFSKPFRSILNFRESMIFIILFKNSKIRIR